MLEHELTKPWGGLVGWIVGCRGVGGEGCQEGAGSFKSKLGTHNGLFCHALPGMGIQVCSL